MKSSSLSSEKLLGVLAELRAIGEREDDLYRQRIRIREAQLGCKLYGAERAAVGINAPLAVSPEVGQVLHALVLTSRPALIVEFGSSLGISTIYLASALRDVGFGSVITTELVPEKAHRAMRTLADAGLDDRVEMRVGDALSTLIDIPREIDVLFLDGSNDLYLPVLELLRPRLSRRAIIAADMSPVDPHHERYRAYVSDPVQGLLSTEIALDAGLVLSTPAPDPRDRQTDTVRP